MSSIETVKVINIETSKAESSVKSLKQRMKELKDELADLEEGTEEYMAKSQELGALMRQQADITENARFATQDLGDQLSAGTKILQGGIGAITGITSALSLMGVEMGEDTKLQQKLVSAIALLSSIDAIDTSIKAFKGLTASLKTSTIAQRALNTVMKANPYMLVASAVAILATAIGGYALATRKAKEDNDDLIESNKELEKSYESLASYLDRYTERLEMKSSEWYKKVQDTFFEMEKQAGYNDEQLLYNLTQLGEKAVETGDKATAGLASAVEAYLKYVRSAKESQAEQLKAEQNFIALWKKQTAEAKKTTTVVEDHKDVVEELTKTYDEFESRRNQAQKAYNTGLVTEHDYIQANIYIEEDLLKTLQANTEEYDKQIIKIQELRNKLTEADHKNALNAMTLSYDQAFFDTKLTLLEAYYEKKQELDQQDTDNLIAKNHLEENLTRQLYELEQSSIQNSMALLAQQHEFGLLSKEQYLAEQRALEVQLTENEINESNRRIEIAQAEKVAKIEIEKLLQETKLQLATQIGGLFGSIAEGLDAETEEYKNLKAAQAIIDTLSASVSAFTGITKDTGGWGLALALAQAATVITTGMATVKKIYAVNTNGSKNSTSVSTNVSRTLERNYTNTRLTDGSGVEVDLSHIADQINDKKVVLSLNDFHTADNKYTRVKTKNTF